MRKRNYSELGTISSAFATLRQMNAFVLFPLDEQQLDNPLLLEYFESKLGDPVEKKIEDVFSIAAARTVYDNPNIPVYNKERSAKNTARDFREAMRYAKLEYHAQTKNLSVREYNKRKKTLPIVRRAVKIRKLKAVGKNVAISTVVGLLTGPVGAAATFIGRVTWSVLPDKVKKPIQKTVKHIVEKTVTTIKNVTEKIKQTKVGKAVANVVQNMRPYFQKVVDTVRPVAQKVVTEVKKVGRKVFDYAKSWWPF